MAAQTRPPISSFPPDLSNYHRSVFFSSNLYFHHWIIFSKFVIIYQIYSLSKIIFLVIIFFFFKFIGIFIYIFLDFGIIFLLTDLQMPCTVIRTDKLK